MKFFRSLAIAAALLGLCAPAHAALKVVPLACETTSDTVGALDLAGAAAGYLSFSAAGMSSGDTAYYQIRNGSKHGEGIGTYTSGTPNTFTRDASENSTDGLATPLTLSGSSTICLGQTSQTMLSPTLFGDLDADSFDITGAGDIRQDTAGSNTTSPRVFGAGIGGFAAGEAARWIFGDDNNGIQNAWGDRMQIWAYHGIEIRGATGAIGSPSFVAGSGASDPSLSVFGDMLLTGGDLTLDSGDISTNATSQDFVLDADGTPLTALLLDGGVPAFGGFGSSFATIDAGASSFPFLMIKNSLADDGPYLATYNDASSSTAAGGYNAFGRDNSNNLDIFAGFDVSVTDGTAGSVDAAWAFNVKSNDNLIAALTLGGTGVVGVYDHIFDLGSASFGSLEVRNSAADDGGPGIAIYQNSASPAADDAAGFVNVYGKDSGGNDIAYSSIGTAIVDPTNGSEDSSLGFYIQSGGGLLGALTLGGFDFDSTYGAVFDFGGTSGELTVQSSSDGAFGTYVHVRHDSATPAANDTIGAYGFYGRDSAANNQQYGLITSTLVDPTSTDEYSHVAISAMQGGSSLTSAIFGSNQDTGIIPAAWGDPVVSFFTTDSYSFEFTRTFDDLWGPALVTMHERATPADGDAPFNLEAYGRNDADEKLLLAGIYVDYTDVSNDTEDTAWNFYFRDAGAWTLGFGTGSAGTIVGPSAAQKGEHTLNAQNGLYDKGFRVGEVLLTSGTFTNVSDVAFVLTSYTANYREIRIRIHAQAVSAYTDLYWFTSTDGGSTYDSGSSDYNRSLAYQVFDDVTSWNTSGEGTTCCPYAGWINASGYSTDLELVLSHPNDARQQYFKSNGWNENYIWMVGFNRVATADVDAIQLNADAASNITGSYAIYGSN